MTAVSSMRLFVVAGSPPQSSFSRSRKTSSAPQPPGPGFPLHAPSGKAEAAFRLQEQTVDKAGGRNDMIFTFANPRPEFPQRIVYRRASEGWLYATVEGKVGGADRQVTYPMRRVDCESGEFILR